MGNEVTFFGAFKDMWARIFDYSGVSGRKQFWLPFALHAVIALIASGLILVSLMVDRGGLFFCLAAFILIGYLVLSIIPWISLTVRRLRDSGRSGWWTLLVLIFGIGMIILLVLCTSASTIYNYKSTGSFNPYYNEPVAVYGPPEYFNPSNNEPEDVYGPPMDDGWQDPVEDTTEDENFNPDENMPEVIYGPPEMLQPNQE